MNQPANALPAPLKYKLDKRLRLLSPSDIVTLHKCPRKRQLQRLWPERIWDASIDTAFGKMFGEGVQQILAHQLDFESLMIKAALEWDVDIQEPEKDGKSFTRCWNALVHYARTVQDSDLANYEVVMYNGKPACELAFSIKLPYGYYYRGKIDLVLQHRISGKYLVVDIKTTGARYTNPAKFQNSAQVLGYSIIMDKIAPGLQSFECLYYEYLSSTRKWESHPFQLDYLDRAMWIRDLMIDVNILEFVYADLDEWPKHGEACAGYGMKSCQFLQHCTMQTENLVDVSLFDYDTDAMDIEGERDKWEIHVTLDELINAQQQSIR